jgi:hypothetical protein
MERKSKKFYGSLTLSSSTILSIYSRLSNANPPFELATSAVNWKIIEGTVATCLFSSNFFWKLLFKIYVMPANSNLNESFFISAP